MAPLKEVWRVARAFLYRMMVSHIAKNRGVVIYYADPSQTELYDEIVRIKQSVPFLLGHHEAYQIGAAVKATEKIPGALAEVGVYEGGSALLMSGLAPGKTVHLFDTFEGLPQDGTILPLKKGEYAADYERVAARFADRKNVVIHRGVFPGTAVGLEGECFSFVHLDTDLYESTLDGLRFFHPRMSKGGIIISHDYVGGAEVQRAFAEYFINKPEAVIEVSGTTQCMVVKIS